MSLRAVRLSGLLLAASLVLHEAAFALGGGGLVAAHHYLEVVIPLVAALGASVTLATLVAHSLGAPAEEPQPHEPFALAAVLLGIFVFQETVEATLLGGGMQALLASASVAWLAPLAILLGALLSGLIAALERVGLSLAVPPGWRPEHPWGGGFAAAPAPSDLHLRVAACCGLAFGFSRRPPRRAPDPLQHPRPTDGRGSNLRPTLRDGRRLKEQPACNPTQHAQASPSSRSPSW